jgi:hypothetical protein
MGGKNEVGLCERSWGYEVRVVESGLVLVDRRLWGIAYGAAALAGSGGILAGGTFIALGASPGADVAAEVPIHLGLGAMFLAVGGVFYRVYRHRRDRPESELAGTLVVDRETGALKDKAGLVLARLEDVRVVVRTDFAWTRGVAEVVSLRWPGGRRAVFRSTSRARIASVVAVLVDAGL